MHRFAYECSRIDAAIRQIARLRRQRTAVGDADYQRALDYEICEHERIVELLRSHIEREMQRDRPLLHRA